MEQVQPVQSTETRTEYQAPALEQHEQFTTIVGASI
jgi:hypothetical protein